MSEYTPGPWTAYACDDFYQIQGRGAYVAEVFNRHEANARLIAAAPELYEALGDMMIFEDHEQYNPDDDPETRALKRARKALGLVVSQEVE